MVIDKELIDAAAKGLKIEKRPFKDLAERFNLTEQEVTDRIQRLIKEKKIRRFAASVRHQHMGFGHNAMILAKVKEEELDKVGHEACAIKAVSHCYQRSHPDGHPYCLYIMAHARDGEKMERIIDQVKSLDGIESIEVCSSLVELKKTSVSNLITDLKNLP